LTLERGGWYLDLAAVHTDQREPQMTQTIDVTGLSPDAVQAIESLVAVFRAQAANGDRTAADRAAELPATVERLLDRGYQAACDADTSPEVSLAEVRAGLATIPGDMTADFAAERDDR
jgi:hypothetical protein